MSEFSKLRNMVDDGSIRLINIVGVPRSMSTALGRALNESDNPSVFINEPFNRNNRSLEVASLAITQTVKVSKLPDQKLTVVTKNMAAYLSADAFESLSLISDANLWSVRDPRIQMGSLITRIANDVLFETGADIVTQDNMQPQHLNAVTDFLMNSDLSRNFSRTGWTSIVGHYRSYHGLGELTIVDGEQLTAAPAAVLNQLANTINLSFSERMIGDWQSDYTNINTGSSRYDARENAWTKHAASASGITPTNRAPLDLESLPSPLRHHITEVAIPAYQEITRAI